MRSPLLWTAQEARDFERHLQVDLGLAPALLMENAARSLAEWIMQIVASNGLTRILFLAGPGNNGADALVAARHLAGGGLPLQCGLPLGLPAAGSLGAGALLTLQALGIHPLPPGPISNFLEPETLVVDGLFGIGLSRPLEDAALACVGTLATGAAPILAVDIPSGLDATRGEVLGAAVRARWTLTFGGIKAGLRLGAGPVHAGEVRSAGLGIPPAYAEAWLARRRGR